MTEIECLVPDLGGIARGKILPTNKFIQGLKDDTHRLPQSIFIQTFQSRNLKTGVMECLKMSEFVRTYKKNQTFSDIFRHGWETFFEVILAT